MYAGRGEARDWEKPGPKFQGCRRDRFSTVRVSFPELEPLSRLADLPGFGILARDIRANERFVGCPRYHSKDSTPDPPSQVQLVWNAGTRGGVLKRGFPPVYPRRGVPSKGETKNNDLTPSISTKQSTIPRTSSARHRPQLPFWRPRQGLIFSTW